MPALLLARWIWWILKRPRNSSLSDKLLVGQLPRKAGYTPKQILLQSINFHVLNKR